MLGNRIFAVEDRFPEFDERVGPLMFLKICGYFPAEILKISIFPRQIFGKDSWPLSFRIFHGKVDRPIDTTISQQYPKANEP